MSTDRPAFYTAREVAAKMRVTPHTVSQWAGRGKIPSIKTPGGGQRLYPADVIDAMLDADAQPTVQPARPRRKPKPVPAAPAAPVPDVPEPPELDGPPLPAYMDAVVAALLDAGIGVRDHECDEGEHSIGIELDPIDGSRTPVMLWTPQSGWRIAVAENGQIDPARIHYLALGVAGTPDHVARTVRHWRASPSRLTREQPAYTAPPRPELDRILAVHARRRRDP